MSLTQQTAQDIARRIVYLETSGRMRMAEWLALVAEFDRRGAAGKTGFSGTANWLAYSCDMPQRTAREHVRVARRLSELPAVAAAFGHGRLSYAKVRAITRAEPSEDERELLDVAMRSTATALERHVQQLRSSRSADLETANAGHARRVVNWFFDRDGTFRFFGRLSAADGAVFAEAVSTKAELLHPTEPVRPDASTGEPPGRPPLHARRADALVDLVSGGGRVQTHLHLHADPAALACCATSDEERSGEVCALRDGPAIPSELARRLTCDAMVSVHGLNHGRTVRLATPSQRRALEDRDGRICRYPGCERTHGLDAHHIVHWTAGGRTDLANLVLLCPYHHRAFHEGGFRLRRRRDATLIISDPTGVELFTIAPGRAAGRARAGPLAMAA